MSGLEKLEISGEKFVSKILISGIHYPNLKSIKLHGMENLMEVNLTRVKTLNCLDITNCKKLKGLTGTSDLTNLILLNISQCPDLEFEDLHLKGMNCLESIKIDKDVKVKYFELDGCQNLKTIWFSCEDLVELIIRDCPELKKLPYFRGPSSLERIIIDGCQICDLQLDGCQNLRSVSGNFELENLCIYGCPELEELASLARLSSMNIVIDSCEKLQKIAGIEELHASGYMTLCYCSNAVIRDCIHKLKSVPPWGMDMIGRAADGAESTLNQDLFSDANIGVDGVTEIATPQTYLEWRIIKELSAIIVCFVVVVDTCTLVEDINQSLKGYGLKLRQGEWVITVIVSDFISFGNIEKISDVLLRYGIMKKGFRVEMNKGEEWKSVGVLQTIVDRLHHL